MLTLMNTLSLTLIMLTLIVLTLITLTLVFLTLIMLMITLTLARLCLCLRQCSLTLVPTLVLAPVLTASFQDDEDRDSVDMELEEFALGESAVGGQRGEGGGGGGGARGLKAAASTAASNLRRNVRSMLTTHPHHQHRQVPARFNVFMLVHITLSAKVRVILMFMLVPQRFVRFRTEQ